VECARVSPWSCRGAANGEAESAGIGSREEQRGDRFVDVAAFVHMERKTTDIASASGGEGSGLFVGRRE
jgi:hypothetical protein